MLNRRDPGGDHLERGVKRVEIEIEAARHHAGDKPQFQWHVRRAELHRGEADMVMAVDEARQKDLVAGADHRDVRVFAAELRVGADLGDDTVLLQHGAVPHLVPPVSVHRMGDHRAAADQRCGHRGSPLRQSKEQSE